MIGNQLTHLIDRWYPWCDINIWNEDWEFDHMISISFLDDILDTSMFKARWPDLRLCIGPQDHGRSPYFNPPCLLFDYPYTNLTSWTVDLSCPCDTVDMDGLITILSASHRLEHLDLRGGENRETRLILNGKNLPPITELALRNMEMSMSVESGIPVWDWSRVSHLKLNKVPIANFLRTVTPEHLPNLRTFITDTWCCLTRDCDHSHLDRPVGEFVRGVLAL